MEVGRGGACVPARVALQGRIHRSIPAHDACIWYGNAAMCPPVSPCRGASIVHLPTVWRVVMRKKLCTNAVHSFFLWNGLPQRGSLQEGFELFFDGGFVGCTDEFVDEFAVFKEKDGGDVAHAKVGGYLVVFFDVAFAYH